jgi:hypothetical protein
MDSGNHDSSMSLAKGLTVKSSEGHCKAYVYDRFPITPRSCLGIKKVGGSPGSSEALGLADGEVTPIVMSELFATWVM